MFKGDLWLFRRTRPCGYVLDSGREAAAAGMESMERDRRQPAPPEPRGVWRSRGYGWSLELGRDGFTMADETAIGRRLCDQGPPGSFRDAFEEVGRDDDGAMRLKHRGDVTTYWFDEAAGRRRPAFDPPDSDPLRNFDALWALFDEHYAFFDLRGVDWREALRRLRPRLVAGAALLDVAAELIAPLGDAHVSITAPERVLDVTSPVRDRKLKLTQTFGAPPWSQDRQGYTDRLQGAFGQMFLGGRFKATANRMMIFGEAAPGIGYLTLFGEFGHADTARSRAALDLPRGRLEAASFLADEIEGLRRALDEAAAAMAHMRALIVDVRLNYGGYDRLALDFAGRFTTERRPAYRKLTHCKGAVVARQGIDVVPGGPSLAHLPVYLLTSRQTASAGEILVLAMMACPNVTRVGESTLGILSDNLYKRLPNGWEVSLSNEIYEAPDGGRYEAAGVPPQVATPVFDPTDVAGGFRHAVARALDLARAAAG